MTSIGQQKTVLRLKDLSRRRRTAVGCCVAILASVGLAACGEAGTGSGSSDASGSGDIVIGVIEPLTGTSAEVGKGQAAGAQAVADAINASGGIKELGGRKIKLVVQDSQSDPVVAGRVIRQLAQQHVAGFVGPQLSAETLANKALLQSLKIPAVIPGTAQALTDDNVNGSLFRLAYTAVDAGKGVVDMTTSLAGSGTIGKPQNIGILSTSTQPGPAVVDAIKQGLGSGVTLTEVVYDPTQVKDFAPIVAKFKAANVDTIMGFQFFSDATLFAQAMSSQTWKPKNGVYETGAALSQDAFRRDFAQSADGWVSAMNSPSIDSDFFSRESRKMAADWPKKHSGATIEGSTAATGASSLTVLVDAIAAAKSTDPKKVTAALRSLSFDKPQGSKYPYYMMAGGVHFNQKQDNEKLIIPWVQVNADKSVTTVFPKQYETGDFRKP